MAPSLIVEPRRKAPGHWAAYQKAMRRSELSFIRELHVEADKRRNYRLQLASIDSLLHHKLYRPQLKPTLEARKAALERATAESLGH